MKTGFLVEFNVWSRNGFNILHPKHLLALLTLCVQGKSFPLVILKLSAIQRGLFTVWKAGRIPELIMGLTARSTGWINTWVLHPLSSERAEGTWGGSWEPKCSSILLPKAAWGSVAIFHNILHFCFGVWAFGNGVHAGFLPFSRLCDLGGNFGHSNWSSHSIYMYYYKFMLLSWNSVLSFPFFEHLRCTTGNLQTKPSKPRPEHGAEVKHQQRWLSTCSSPGLSPTACPLKP